MGKILRTAKLTFIVLGLSSGMTAGALFYFHNLNSCQAMVLRDMDNNTQFRVLMSNYTPQVDFLTELTQARGR